MNLFSILKHGLFGTYLRRIKTVNSGNLLNELALKGLYIKAASPTALHSSYRKQAKPFCNPTKG
jgi:hypothetical protein